jgi:hypothetical protein
MVKKGELSVENERKVFIAISVLGFFGALICLSPNMTGNIIGELSKDSSNLVGILFVAIGIIALWITRIKG